MVRSKQDMIDEVMDNFNFHKVQQVLEALDWKWVGTDSGVATEAEARSKARGLLSRAYDLGQQGGRSTYISTCGFRASYDPQHTDLSLVFEVDKYSTSYGVL